MKKILIAAAAAMLATGAGLFGASAADKLKISDDPGLHGHF